MVLHVHTSQTFDLGYNYNSLSVIFCYIPILDDYNPCSGVHSKQCHS